jgi:hypothetical protein
MYVISLAQRSKKDKRIQGFELTAMSYLAVSNIHITQCSKIDAELFSYFDSIGLFAVVFNDPINMI